MAAWPRAVPGNPAWQRGFMTASHWRGINLGMNDTQRRTVASSRAPARHGKDLRSGFEVPQLGVPRLKAQPVQRGKVRIMNLEEVRAIAKAGGIKVSKVRRKSDLIKTIQLAEGNFDCFASAFEGQCDQMGCCWRAACFEAAGHSRAAGSRAMHPETSATLD
jgi:hypothetical protein